MSGGELPAHPRAVLVLEPDDPAHEDVLPNGVAGHAESEHLLREAGCFAGRREKSALVRYGWRRVEIKRKSGYCGDGGEGISIRSTLERSGWRLIGIGSLVLSRSRQLQSSAFLGLSW